MHTLNVHCEKMFYVVYVFCLLIIPLRSERRFPPWFKLGASTSSHQVEGAWNVSDKTPSSLDDFAHTYGRDISNGVTGDVACDSYHQYQKDIEIAATMGLDHYRFSISWTRLLPDGFASRISEDGRQYYDNLINGLLERGVEPMVTLYQWELPKVFQDLGGWGNPMMVDLFADFADVVFSLYADRVKLWITINEPIILCDFMTGKSNHRIKEPVFAPYVCTKTTLLAHAKAYHIYNEKYKPLFGGKVSISHNGVYYVPKTEDDIELTDLYMQYNFGRFMSPIHSAAGGWPPALERYMWQISMEQGLPRSRLPELTEHEIEYIKGTFDFISMNYYATRRVRKARDDEDMEIDYFALQELRATFEMFPNSNKTFPVEFTPFPKGLRGLLKWIADEYGDQEIFITENGYTTLDVDLKDFTRIDYIQQHLDQILLSIYEDGVRVIGYTYWSMMDSFEFGYGYRPKYGLYEVDFNDDNRTRTPRLSAQYYGDVIKRRTTIYSQRWIERIQNLDAYKKPLPITHRISVW